MVCAVSGPAGRPTAAGLAIVTWALGAAASGVEAATVVSGAEADVFAAALRDSRGASQAVRMVLGLTLLALVPALLVCVTAFLRIVIVLSLLRHALGMPETPPNPVLIALALFLTLFTMAPVLHQLNVQALQPFMAGTLDLQGLWAQGTGPLRDFMLRQTRAQDLALLVELSRAPVPAGPESVSLVQLVPAFMLSELRVAFQIGILVLLPFLLIDLVVASALMGLGMMMLPPSIVALPLKILMFVLVDGWALLLKGLVGSFR